MIDLVPLLMIHIVDSATFKNFTILNNALQSNETDEQA